MIKLAVSAYSAVQDAKAASMPTLVMSAKLGSWKEARNALIVNRISTLTLHRTLASHVVSAALNVINTRQFAPSAKLVRPLKKTSASAILVSGQIRLAVRNVLKDAISAHITLIAKPANRTFIWKTTNANNASRTNSMLKASVRTAIRVVWHALIKPYALAAR